MRRYLAFYAAIFAVVLAACISTKAHAADVFTASDQARISKKDTSFGPMAFVEGDVVNWSGIYFGGQVGTSIVTLGDEDGAGGISAQGPEGGFRAGYDFAVGRLVAGVYGEYNWSGAEIEAGGVTLLQKDNEWTVCGRAGAVATPRALIYGLVCYGQAEFSSPAFAVEDSFDLWKAGGGIQLAATGPLNLGLEITHTWYDLGDDAPSQISANEWRIMLPITFKLGDVQDVLPSR